MQVVNIEKYWKKMLYGSTSRNKIPAWYLSISKNARIKDDWITKRRWYQTIIEAELDWYNQGITYNDWLFFCAENALYKANLDDNTYTKIGDLDESEFYNFVNYWKHIIILTGVGKPWIYNGVSLFQLGNDSYQPAYLTGKDKPTKEIAKRKSVTDWEFKISIDWTDYDITWLDFSNVASLDEVCDVIQAWIRNETSWQEIVRFNDKNVFVISSWNITDASEISKTSKISWWTGTDISGESSEKYLDMKNWEITEKVNIDAPNINPIIWATFTGFTFIVGNTKDTKNVLYISRPITVDNPERCYDWLWDNSEQITFDSNILGLASTMNQLFIFTENKIEYIWKDSLQVIGESATLITTPVWDGGKLANYRTAIAAWNRILYLTKTNSINALNYIEWTAEPWIWILSDHPMFRITTYLDELDEDQKDAFGYYDDYTKTAHWFLKTKNSPYNDTILVYDLINETWTTDTRKFFNDAVFHDTKVFAGSALNCDIIQDNIWLNDNDNPIEFEIQDTDISLGTIREKMFGWREISWWLNVLANINIKTLIDDKISTDNSIIGLDYASQHIIDSLPWEIAGTTVGWTGIGWLPNEIIDEIAQFDKSLDHSYLWKRGKRIKRIITENSYWSDFYLDYYSIIASITWNVELNDKF